MKTKVIPYGCHQITKSDIDAVVNVLKSEFLTQGPKIIDFEKAFANYIGSKYAISVSNGTAALHLSAIALGVGPGKRVISSPLTFAASTNCILCYRKKAASFWSQKQILSHYGVYPSIGFNMDLPVYLSFDRKKNGPIFLSICTSVSLPLSRCIYR